MIVSSNNHHNLLFLFEIINHLFWIEIAGLEAGSIYDGDIGASSPTQSIRVVISPLIILRPLSSAHNDIISSLIAIDMLKSTRVLEGYKNISYICIITYKTRKLCRTKRKRR